MQPLSLLARLAQCLIVICCLSVWPSAAQASVVGTMADILQWMEDHGVQKPVPFDKVPSQDLRDSEPLINCVMAGKSVDECFSMFINSPLADKASDGYIPKIIELYAAVDDGDVGEVVSILGEPVLCIVASMMTTAGTVDICGLFEELVKVAEAAYDAAKWLVNVFGDTLGDIADSLGCLFGCDDTPPPPEEYYVYTYIYAPKVKDGAAAIEQSQPAFDTLRATLAANATHPGGAILSTPAVVNLQPVNQWPVPFSKGAVAKAEDAFVKAVNAQWSADMQSVVPKLLQARSQYDKDETAANLAKAGAEGYIGKQNTDVHGWFVNACVGHFTDLGYAVVDRWLVAVGSGGSAFPPEAQQIAGDLEGNSKWCGHFWEHRQAAIAAVLRDAASGQHCPLQGDTLLCQSLAGYKTCAGLMGSVGQQAQCDINATYVGGDIAREIVAWFKSQNSKYADGCTIPKVMASPGSKTPATLTCPRPTMPYHCDKYYQQYYGKLPVKALECKLGDKQPANYQQMEDDMWGSRVKTLEAKHAGLSVYVKKGVDPLRLLLPAKLYDEVAQDAKALDFDLLPAAMSEPSIDGVEKPTLARDTEAALRDQARTVPANTAERSKRGVNPPDPTGGLSTQGPAGQTSAASAPQLPGAQQPALGEAQVKSGKLPPPAPGRDTGAAASPAGGSAAGQAAVAAGPVATARSPAREASPAAAVADRQGCEFDLRYLAPQAPVVETAAASLAARDQVRITCRFAIATTRVSLPTCDEQARRTAERLGAPGAATSRVLSGAVAVDGQTINVSSIPAGSQSFEKTAIWSFSQSGSHSVACLVDNPLGGQVRGADPHVETTSSLQVGPVAAKGAPVGFDPAQARPLPTRVTTPPPRTLPGSRATDAREPAPTRAATPPGPGARAAEPPASTGQVPEREAPASRSGLPRMQDAQMPEEEVPASRTGLPTGQGAQVPEEEVPMSRTGLPAVQGAQVPEEEVPMSRTGLPAVQGAQIPEEEVSPSARRGLAGGGGTQEAPDEEEIPGSKAGLPAVQGAQFPEQVSPSARTGVPAVQGVEIQEEVAPIPTAQPR